MSERTQGNDVVSGALERLRGAAHEVGTGWSPAWRWVRSDGAEEEVQGFADIDLVPGFRQVVRARLTLPDRLHGVELAGEPLALRVDGIFPTRVSVDGTVLVDEVLPTLATGPVLVEAVRSITAGDNGEIEVEIVRPASQGDGPAWTNWISVHLSTPRLRQRFDQLDLAWARLRLAQELATAEDESAAVTKAAQFVPALPLELTDADLRSSLERMAHELEPLAERAADVDVHVIGHSHIDLAWLWTWDETREVIKRDVRSVLGIMRDYPEVTFTHSQPAGYEVIRQEEPELFAEIHQRVREGRWEPATAQWVEGDTTMASGEAMASQLLEGVSFTRRHLGVDPRVFLAPDTFGHAANLPQLVVDAGVKVYYHHRCNPGGRHGRWPAYWWEGLDGTRVLAVSTHSYNGELSAGAIADASIEAVRAGLPAALLFVGVGDHGGGPTRQGYDRLRMVGSAPGMPTAYCSTVSAYGDAVMESGVRLPVHRGESPAIFEGCYTTHADAKRANRDGENRLVTAETLAALAGLPRDEALTRAWRDLCFHQFHDILPGSAIKEVYAKTRDDHERLVAVTDRIVEGALGVLHRGLDGGVAVTNPMGHDRTDVVWTADLPVVPAGATTVALTDAAGRLTYGQVSDDGRVFFVARVPAFGTAHYVLSSATLDEVVPGLTVRAEPGTRVSFPGPSESDENRYWRVETPHFSVAVRQDSGIITSFVDKRVDRELVAWGMQRLSDYIDSARPDLGLNVFQLVDERPHSLSAWQYAEVDAEHSWVHGATTELVEAGPVRIVLRVRHAVRSSVVVEDIVFYRDLPRVDFVARVDWQEPGGPEHGVPNLKVSFAPDVDECDAWFEVPYGAVRRRSNGQQVPAVRWADVGGADYGVAVLNDAVYGHDVLGNRLRLTLLRTASDPDPRSDQGEYTFGFSLVPHVGDWRRAGVAQLAGEFNQPLTARVHPAAATSPSADEAPAGSAALSDVEPASGWSPRVESAAGAVSTVLRSSRDGSGTIVRLAESSGQEARYGWAGCRWAHASGRRTSSKTGRTYSAADQRCH